MQKGVDAVAIGVIAFGIIALIALFVISNNMMPSPLPTVQPPQIESTRALLQNPTVGGGAMGAPGGAPGGFGAGPGSMGGGGMLGGGGFEGSSAGPAPSAPRGRSGMSEDL